MPLNNVVAIEPGSDPRLLLTNQGPAPHGAKRLKRSEEIIEEGPRPQAEAASLPGFVACCSQATPNKLTSDLKNPSVNRNSNWKRFRIVIAPPESFIALPQSPDRSG
jgi:hypothetical protein